MKVRTLAVIALAFLTTTCTQSPIFHIISTETAPTTPRIEGAPTNMVVFNWEYEDLSDPPQKKSAPIMFVASGRLHWYAQEEIPVTDTNDPNYPLRKESRWDSGKYGIPQPVGKIASLAVAQNRLYALCLENQTTNAVLRYIESDGDTWKNISAVDNYPLQSIYADPEEKKLFVGARKSNSNSFAIYYLDPDLGSTLKSFKDGTALLSGAIYDGTYFYLSTRTNMIFRVDNDINYMELSVKDGDNVSFRSMIKLEDPDRTIIAVTREGGFLYKVEADTLRQIKSGGGGDLQTGNYSMGSLCLWEGPIDSRPLGTNKKLIAGIQGGLYTSPTSSSSTSYTHGYVEFDLYADGSLNPNSSRHDKGSLESAGDNDRYSTSLGKQPINHLFQAPKEIDESNRVFFASTQTSGLWSFRDRPDNGGWQWNAEE